MPAESKNELPLFRVETIEQLHSFSGLEKPKHSAVTIIDYSKVDVGDSVESGRFALNFYSINFKKNCSFAYGKKQFDHLDGTLHCTAPDQVITYDRENDQRTTTGWGLYFHSDFILNSSLCDKIHDYSFFLYDENEALHLTLDEENTLVTILKLIESEYNKEGDSFSEELIITNIELLLNYCKRFYNRQFITRKKQNHTVISRFEKFITAYVNSENLKTKGLPSVKYCAENMNLTPNYFSDLLKNETGKNTQEHIHFYILEKAKKLLISSNNTINEISYELGFEYPQYFSTLFKKKLGITPQEYRLDK